MRVCARKSAIVVKATVIRQFRTWSLASTSAASIALSLGMTHSAYAQSPVTSQQAQTPAVEEIVVTGTRVVRDGYEAPTPVTVVGVEQLQHQASSNIIDVVASMPAFSGSLTPTTTTQSVSNGQSGLSALNLRNLGGNRTLVLVDGQRSVGSTITGLVDINTIPQQLISRVDVVTGGASAAYGSDALAGVANFILDKKFTGIKADFSAGVTTYGDDRNFSVAITAGTPFAGDRGHFIISGELADDDGILQGDRPWNKQGWQIINNPNYTATNGQPQRLLLSHVAAANASPGGMIVSGPLKGIVFGPGGTPSQFNYGSLVSGAAMAGGDWQSVDIRVNGQSLDPQQNRQNIFLRASYDLTDDVEVFIQSSWSYNKAFSVCCSQEFFGGLVVTPDNAFLPASVKAQAQALKLPSIELGSTSLDMGQSSTYNRRTVIRNVVGASGKFDALDTNWGWDAYFQAGKSRNSLTVPSTPNLDNYFDAIDAVAAPNGAIVCRSTLTNPTNGCVPYNIFGIGVNSKAALNYVLGASHLNADYEQTVEAVSLHGEPLSSWAGPISLALGIEHRNEKAYGAAPPLDLLNVWYVGDYHPTFGSYNVTEGFVETVVPLAKDTSWAKSLDLNAAVRATSYSTAGYVTTWKVGATYAPIDDIRLRATRSRDIRAPNLNDLYNAGTSTSNNIINPVNNQSVPTLSVTLGNPNLVPEKADTTGVGVVVQPGFLPGFNAAVDYWNIDISNAIGSVTAQQTADLCFQGNLQFCSSIIGNLNNNTGTPITIDLRPYNLVQQISRGIDFEASYRTALSAIMADWGGNLTIRALATHYLKNYSNNVVTPPTDSVGQNSGSGPAHWRWNANVDYDNEALSVGLGARGVSAGVYSNTNIECTSGCPTSTVANRTVNVNYLPGAVYFDFSLSYKIVNEGPANSVEAFLNIKNIANTDPVIVAGGPSGIPHDTTNSNPTFYDVLGRVFRAGVRFRM
jgi:outer membrane receptor protein involved in Fe transport